MKVSSRVLNYLALLSANLVTEEFENEISSIEYHKLFAFSVKH